MARRSSAISRACASTLSLRAGAVSTDILEFLARVLVIQAASYGGGRAAPIPDTVLPVYSGDPLVPGSRLHARARGAR
jgi:hypothetical protein